MLSKEDLLIKLNNFNKSARDAVSSTDIITKLGGITIYAGLIDFFCIQLARTMEQIILKSQLKDGLTPTFEPREDNWFYDNKINTRKIVKEIEKLLPFKSHPKADSPVFDPEVINKKIQDLCDQVKKFLNYRIVLIHYAGNPKTSEKDVENIISRIIPLYKKIEMDFSEVRKLLHPFTFSEYERKIFYNDDQTKGIIILSEVT